jgi:hypothetical protein
MSGPLSQAFCEVRLTDAMLLDDVARFQLDLSNRGSSVEPSALEEKPVSVD